MAVNARLYVDEGVQERERMFRSVSMRECQQNGTVPSAAVHASRVVQTA